MGHISQSSSSHKCTSHLGFSLGSAWPHPKDSKGPGLIPGPFQPVHLQELIISGHLVGNVQLPVADFVKLFVVLNIHSHVPRGPQRFREDIPSAP